MSGGIINDNSSKNSIGGGYGGGMYIAGGTFAMTGGIISGNYSIYAGGGVCIFNGSFTMSGGTISDNFSQNSYGGGVSIYDLGIFTKSGPSVIYGDTDTTHTTGISENTAGGGFGHAVFWGYGGKQRDATLGSGDNLSTLDPSLNWD
jgi:hypothetical protein